MTEWQLGNWNKPLGQAIIYCKQSNGTYLTAFSCAIKKEAFYDELQSKCLEQVIKTAKIRELDIIFIGKRDGKENCEKLILEQIAEYDELYNSQPANIKKASSRLPTINQ